MTGAEITAEVRHLLDHPKHGYDGLEPVTYLVDGVETPGFEHACDLLDAVELSPFADDDMQSVSYVAHGSKNRRVVLVLSAGEVWA